MVIFGLGGIWACSSTGYYVSDDQEEWREKSPSRSEELLYRLFLVGDSGAPLRKKTEPSLRLLKSKLDSAGENSAVIFLGDNIYPSGMPDSADPGRAEAERRLTEQLETMENFKGRVFVIPGNHDWEEGGREAVRRQEQFVEAYLDRGNTFLPDDGFPGPIEIELMDDDDHPDLREDIRLVILDTQWWFEGSSKPFGDTGEYLLNDAGDFLVQLDIILRDRRNDHVTVVGHHPLFSNGTHNGYYPLRTHFLPPVFGSLYVAYRKFLGYEQDLPSSRYRLLKGELLALFEQHDDLIYASGHEHALQYFQKEGKRLSQHYVVSGTATRQGYVRKGHGADFVSDRSGFGIISYYSDGSSWLEFWTPSPGKPEGKLLFRSRLGEPYADPFGNEETALDNREIPDYSDSTVTVAANPGYDEAGWLTRLLLGSHNRELWSIPVEVPVFDIGSIDGGLTPTEVGGTGQSTTLRLQAESGREYVLRSVDKQAGRIWEEELKDTFAHDLAQDQFSIIHPYGAFIIPELAEAAGIYHTNPKLYYVPHDPRLGRFAELMGGQLALFEERPDNDMSDVPSMGRSEEVLSIRQMIQEVDGDVDHRVDQRAFLRARLFDMVIADWDRHPDQWRWASFEPADKQGKIYRPIPRDRDAAFMRMNGIIPTIGKLNIFYQYQDFRSTYGNLKGLTLNSRGQSRRFTNRLSREDWIAIADSMRNELSDEVIEQAVAGWPESVYKVDGARTIATLKARRDKLRDVAESYYELLNEVVDVAGSHKHERFVIKRLNDRETKVTVEKRTRDGEFREIVYERIFDAGETRELRLFGLSGVDRFDVSGDYNNGIKIIIVGGPGPDTFNDQSKASGRSRARIYDNRSGNRWNTGKGTKVVRSNKPSIHDYNYLYDFRYNRTDPVLFFGSNNDDGLFVGGGIKIRKHAFRTYPFGREHTIRANFAAATQAWNLRYDGLYRQVAGDWDATLDFDLLSPNNIRNYFGLGNETENTEANEDFYRARFSEYRIAAGIQRTLESGITLALRPTLKVTDFRLDEQRFVAQPQAGVSNNIFDDQWFGGFEAVLNMKSLDNELNPKQGFSWQNSAEVNIGLRNTSDNYSSLHSNLGMFYSPVLSPQLTIASRIGFAHNIGTFPFYGSNTLGSEHNLRGYRNTRFAGRTSAYSNLEVRAKLLNLYTYIFGGEFGILGFYDVGRVWTDGERSSLWHRGYGGGLWFSVYGKAIINGTVGFSKEGVYYSIGSGFFF